MDNEIAAYFIDQLEAYSPSGKEGAMASVVKKQLAELAYHNVRTDNVGNVIGRLPGTGTKILVCGHMDTVRGRIPASFDNGIFRGRGSVDAKSPLLALMLGSAKAKGTGVDMDITFVAAVGEEESSNGIYNLIRKGVKAKYAIFGEPSNTVDLTVGYRGRLLVELTVTTETHHASTPWQGVNAIETNVCLFNRIKEFYGEGKNFRDTSVSLTGMNGGQSHNVTPPRSRSFIDLRYPPSKSQEEVMEEISHLITPVSGQYDTSLRIVSSVRPYVANMKSPLIDSFKLGIRKISGKTPHLLFKSGTGDMNILGNECSIEAVTYGPGIPVLSHTSNEAISLNEIKDSIKVISASLQVLDGR